MSIVKAQGWATQDGVFKNSVIQCVSTVKTDTTYINSTSWVDMGISCVIDVKTPTNKVFVNYSLSVGGLSGHSSIRLMRVPYGSSQDTNGTMLSVGNPSGSRTYCTHQLWAAGTGSQQALGYSIMPVSNAYLDQPGYGKWIYYFLCAQPWSSTYYCGVNYHPYSDGDASWTGRTTSVMTLMEIQA